MLYVEILGNLPSLAEGEVKTLLELASPKFNLAERDYLFLALDADESAFSFLERLGMAHEAGILLFSADSVDELYSKAEALDWGFLEEPFAVRRERMLNCRHDVKDVERTLGGIIAKEGLKVNLRNPKSVIRVYCGEKLWVGVKRIHFDPKGFEKRKAHNRPFFKPISLHPRLSRAMVNLSRAREEVLDPFMGLGGILIEAGLMGIKAYGVDIREDMVEGARGNLEFFGVKDYDLRVGDATKLREIFERSFEAIATDPPYGTSATLAGREREELYRKALESMYDVLNGYLSIAFPVQFDASKVAEKIGFEVLERYYQRVHGSLERYFYVMRV
ncbi:TIGR01177 family methyltransferase [Palaeococcus pacificus]|nr:TIGR01177 family methyltransferase [Palaeococcus pacificus]